MERQLELFTLTCARLAVRVCRRELMHAGTAVAGTAETAEDEHPTHSPDCMMHILKPRRMSQMHQVVGSVESYCIKGEFKQEWSWGCHHEVSKKKIGYASQFMDSSVVCNAAHIGIQQPRFLMLVTSIKND